MDNQLYYGDNLEVLRRYIKDESVDLCYIDPPFNSKRNYNQIYNNIGGDDKAQAQAFIDTWEWDDHAIHGIEEIITNYNGKFTHQCIALIIGLRNVLGTGSLLAYLVSMTLKITEIHRILKPTGSFYLHCDPNASHYLKLVLDAVFCSQGGEFQNEIIWSYKTGGATKKRFARKHDVIFFYTKTKKYLFNPQKEKSYMMHKYGFKKSDFQIDKETGLQYSMVFQKDVFDIPSIGSESSERLGYPTQKPEALLERIIKASSNENDTILDAYCGCGTTVAVCQRLDRKWIGIDITYQSISLILKRLEDSFGKEVLQTIKLHGIPKDIESATALANKADDRTRKEFEKWAILTYTDNRGIIKTKKGSDQGVDGIAYFQGDQNEPEKIIFQVKSGKVKSGDIRDLIGTMTLENASIAIFITLENPTKDMIKTAKSAGFYQSKYMSQSCDKIQLVTVQDIIENQKRLNIRLSLEVLKSAEKQKEVKVNQMELDLDI
ncbi:DNA methyltransferase [Planktothrix agardhii]|uniref:DNA methyltransferase n=1 Tax=Planktothrix agardhii TaxID=1160 RepID=UPI0028753C7A|nr:DNA methyltransferase [Planktothrix agardhii]MDS1346200.1 DNA methyltransferase [Planktothrix agardhii NRERC-751]